MPAKKAPIEIERASEQGGKRKVRCPICADVVVTLTRQNSADQGLATAFGVSGVRWEAEQNKTAGEGDYGVDWKVLYENHIKDHSAAEITNKVFSLEGAAAGWQRSAEDYAMILEYILEKIAQKNPVIYHGIMDEITAKGGLSTPIPSEIRIPVGMRH